MGYTNPGHCYPYALITIIQESSGDIYAIWPSLTKNKICMFGLTWEEKLEAAGKDICFIKPQNNETFNSDFYAFGFSENDYLYATHKEICVRIKEEMNGGLFARLNKDIEDMLVEYIE